MITTSSTCGTHASAVDRPARLVGKRCSRGSSYVVVIDVPASSDDDCPFQLSSFALPPKDGEIIDRSILSEKHVGVAYSEYM